MTESAPTPEQIADRIAQAVRAGLVRPGTALVQDDLARRFGVSRNPVREALRLLQSQGLVTMTHGGGARVRTLSPADLEELYDLRLLLEPTIASGVVESALGRHVVRLRQLAREARDSDEPDAWMSANFAFHTTLHELSGRPHTTRLLRDLLSAVQPYARANVSADRARHRAELEHDAMIEAIIAGDAATLAAVLEEHIRGARDGLRAEAAEVDPLAAFRPPRPTPEGADR